MPTLPNFPYFSQRDNALNASGACNVTALSMCLYFFGVRGDGSYPQLEDQVYARCEKNGWSRHDPYGLKAVAESYPGVLDHLTTEGTFADIKKAIDVGLPCILHGYFTRFGHIIAVKGYDDTGLIVNDSWGEWFESGYVNKRGEGLHYSYGMIARLCSPESAANPRNLWLHRISRK